MKYTLAGLPLVAFTGFLAMALSGCGGSSGGAITKQQEEMMRKPAGQTPMPAEAVQAMQQAQQQAAAKARAQATRR